MKFFEVLCATAMVGLAVWLTLQLRREVSLHLLQTANIDKEQRAFDQVGRRSRCARFPRLVPITVPHFHFGGKRILLTYDTHVPLLLRVAFGLPGTTATFLLPRT